MYSFLMFGGILILFQLIYVIWISQLNQIKAWIKFIPSWSMFILGVLFIPVSTLVVGRVGVLLAGAGTTMVITSLLTIPVITLLQESSMKKLRSN
ncbi:hypothetical protein ACERII_22605 [Evansella sp. AB-rgal1]|uniref:hypothetical protein n=1 Tax=Evansella sp. AB-rgal1 TaxID=3242696 RepID=UPI00359EB806